MAKFGDSEVYPNSPLKDVACEIRFPGEMEIECNRHRFWQEIRSDYPKIYVPKTDPRSYPALQHYRFGAESGTRKVSVALNSLAFSDPEYDGHEDFEKEFFRVVDIFRTQFKRIKILSRIGWRYINLIPFAREGDTVPISRFLNAELLVPDNALRRPKAVDIRVESRSDDGISILRLATVNRTVDAEESQEALLLDIDFVCDGPDLNIKDYKKHIQAARLHNRSLFEAIITDEYRKYLRGEVL